ncbi:MAG: hypothetical protein H0Z37_05375 [Firmicutes bacterium]|nr:hypothetical protein [Bacillota bacterium]
MAQTSLKDEIRRHVEATLMRGAARRPLQLAASHIYRAVKAEGSWESPNGQWRLRVDGDRLVTERCTGKGWEPVMVSSVSSAGP